MVSTVPPMVQLIVPTARAYVYAGDWVADCPRACGNVEHLYARASRNPAAPRVAQLPAFYCSYCKLTDVPIEWPPNLAEIMAVLMLRPVPHTRNWYPAEHDTAVKFRVPHGQSIDELRAENAEHGVPTGAVA